MIGVLVGLLLLSGICGRTRGLLGGLVGGFFGALVITGMASTANNGELASLYSPAELASNAAPVAVVAAVLALVVPYATGIASFGWGAGALLAAVAAFRTGDAIYILPLVVHVAAAAVVVSLARWRVAAVQPARSCPAERVSPPPASMTAQWKRTRRSCRSPLRPSA